MSFGDPTKPPDVHAAAVSDHCGTQNKHARGLPVIDGTPNPGVPPAALLPVAAMDNVASGVPMAADG